MEEEGDWVDEYDRADLRGNLGRFEEMCGNDASITVVVISRDLVTL